MSQPIIPEGASVAGRRVKLPNRAKNGFVWAQVEVDAGKYLKVRQGMSSARWEARESVTEVDPPFRAPAGS